MGALIQQEAQVESPQLHLAKSRLGCLWQRHLEQDVPVPSLGQPTEEVPTSMSSEVGEQQEAPEVL